MKRGLDPTILAEGIDSDVHELRKSIVNALTVARGLSEAQTSATTPNLQRVDETLAQISQILATSPHTKESRTILELLGRLSQIIKTETTDENLMDRIPLQDAPPVWFERVPRAGGPVVDVQALAESVSGSDSAASGFENFLDGIFSPLSSDTIYEAALRKLRHQLIELYNRNLALELNLDMAEREVRHWRSLYISDPRHMPSTQPQSPSSPKKSILQREIKVVAWKHAVAKFIGSFDQFSMLKVLLHWRLYVQEERRS